MFKNGSKILSKIALVLLVMPSFALALTLSATVDRSTIDIEETLELSVRLDTQAGGNGPDFSELSMNFEILSNNRSTQYRSVNGKAESWTEWKLLLSPKKTGQLLIPSVNYQGLYSDALVIEVKQSAASAPGTTKDIFIEAELSKKKMAVQEQVVLTVKLLTSINLRSINSEEFSIDDAIMVELSELRYQKRINGKPYAVIEVKYALFPQTSGLLNIPPIRYTVTTKGRVRDPWSDPFGTQTGKLKRLTTKALSIPVQSAAQQYTGPQWLPASDLTLSQNWSSDPSTFKVGEPITRVIVLEAKGLTGAQLPPLDLPEVDGIKYYPDQAQTEDQTSENGVTGIRTETVAVVPMKSGRMTLPAIEVNWWDTTSNSQKLAILPAQEINVAAAAVEMPQTPMTSMPEANQTMTDAKPVQQELGPWKMISLVLAVLCFGLVFIVFRMKQKMGANPSQANQVKRKQSALDENEQKAFIELKRACESGDSAAARLAIIDWGKARWKTEPSMNLERIAELLGSETVSEALAQLDADIYRSGDEQQWPANDFLDELGRLRKKKVTRKSERKHLEALYGAN